MESEEVCRFAEAHQPLYFQGFQVLKVQQTNLVLKLWMVFSSRAATPVFPNDSESQAGHA